MTVVPVDFGDYSATFGDEFDRATLFCACEDAGGRFGLALAGDELVLLNDHDRRSLPVDEVRSWSVRNEDSAFVLTIEGDGRASVRLTRWLQQPVVATLTRLLGPGRGVGGPS